MKKFLSAFICAMVAIVSAFGITACSGDKQEISVYVPDGAPALAVAALMSEEPDFGRKVNYHVVGAEEIASCVTYESEDKNADICVLPVNAASKLLGTGGRYKMLGTVTHGNLFIAASADKAELTAENFAARLENKKVGVVNLPAFPGAVFSLILSKYGLTDGVVCENVAATAVSGTDTDYDYFVIPEPAASTRAGNANLNLKIVGSLQELYGENGYPQAVLVAKNSLIQSDSEFISAFMQKMTDGASWLLKDEVSAQTIISAITSHFADPDTLSSFNANNLTKTVIRNSAVRFDDCTVSRSAVVSFLEELKAAGDVSATEVADNFFYSAG